VLLTPPNCRAAFRRAGVGNRASVDYIYVGYVGDFLVYNSVTCAAKEARHCGAVIKIGFTA